MPKRSDGTLPVRQAAHELLTATEAMYTAGVPLMRRIIPAGEAVRLWDHYPDPVADIVCAETGARYFYHVHPPGERSADEHGHFHLFLPRLAMADPQAAKLVPPDRGKGADDMVHIVALSVNAHGLPLGLFTVNRWVTDEWLFAAPDIIAVLDRFALHRTQGDALVGQWLTAALKLCRPLIADLLLERDQVLATAGWAGERRELEVLSTAPLDLQKLLPR